MTPDPRMAGATRCALIGAGGFGSFISKASLLVPEVDIVAVVDADAARANLVASDHGARVATLEDVLSAPDVDAVIVATPPASHYSLVSSALRAGKDVFCEKPFGANAAEATELRELVAATGRVLVVDHVLRYNPLLRALRRIQNHAGWRPRRFLFENDAADQSLPREHWFWDTSISGGIFVEHGVHFFDVAHMFLDAEPETVVAAATRRAGWPAPDIVSATVTHGEALATHTHSFTHLHCAERQLMRFDFGPAEARIHGWIPVSGDLVLFTDESGAAAVRALLEEPGLLAMPGVQVPPESVTIEVAAVTRGQTLNGQGNANHASHRLTAHLTLGGEAAKQSVYAASVAAALADLHHCRAHPPQQPQSNAETAAKAVVVAEYATRAAETGRAEAIPERGNGLRPSLTS